MLHLEMTETDLLQARTSAQTARLRLESRWLGWTGDRPQAIRLVSMMGCVLRELSDDGFRVCLLVN